MAIACEIGVLGEVYSIPSNLFICCISQAQSKVIVDENMLEGNLLPFVVTV